jgi:hypothetical protein
MRDCWEERTCWDMCASVIVTLGFGVLEKVQRSKRIAAHVRVVVCQGSSDLDSPMVRLQTSPLKD